MSFVDVINGLATLFQESKPYTQLLPDDLVGPIGHIAKAKGMSRIANETGMSRPSLYRALAKGSKLQFETIHKVISALGGNLTVNVGQ